MCIPKTHIKKEAHVEKEQESVISARCERLRIMDERVNSRKPMETFKSAMRCVMDDNWKSNFSIMLKSTEVILHVPKKNVRNQMHRLRPNRYGAFQAYSWQASLL